MKNRKKKRYNPKRHHRIVPGLYTLAIRTHYENDDTGRTIRHWAVLEIDNVTVGERDRLMSLEAPRLTELLFDSKEKAQEAIGHALCKHGVVECNDGDCPSIHSCYDAQPELFASLSINKVAE